jgi:hypothetical protein
MNFADRELILIGLVTYDLVTAQNHYDNLDSVQRRDLLLQIGETRERARVLGEAKRRS